MTDDTAKRSKRDPGLMKGAMALRQRAESLRSGSPSQLDAESERELERLLQVLEIGLLVATADGAFVDEEREALALNVSTWIGAPLDRETLEPTFTWMLDVLERDGWDERLAACAKALDEPSRAQAFTLACVIVAADGDVLDEELEALDEIGAALGIGREEADKWYAAIIDELHDDD